MPTRRNSAAGDIQSSLFSGVIASCSRMPPLTRILLLLTFSHLTPPAKATPPLTESFTLNGFRRTFKVDLPRDATTISPKRPLPVLVDFHGYHANSTYERQWTGWPAFLYDKGVLLLTPDGSGGIGDGFTRGNQGWNVLGWSKRTAPLAGTRKNNNNDSNSGLPSSCASQRSSACYGWHAPYPCYRSQLDQDPAACRPSSSSPSSSSCSTMPAQDDVAFVERMLRIAIEKYGADSSRIYLFGQSMGGMATVHMARHLPADLAPAAIVPCSSAAARTQTPTLLPRRGAGQRILHLHGIYDKWVPPTVYSGALSNGSLTTDIFPRHPADPMGGHDLLAPSRSCPAALWSGQMALAPCPAQAKGRAQAQGQEGLSPRIFETISADGFLFDPLVVTLEGYNAGRPINASSLVFEHPPEVASATARAMIKCATVSDDDHGRRPKGASASTTTTTTTTSPADLRVCLFDGPHCLPFMNGGESGADCNWLPVADGGRVLLEFVYQFIVSNPS